MHLLHGGILHFFPFGNDGVITLVGSVSGGHFAAKNPVLADVHAAMLTEGTKKTTKKELQEKLDALGASVSFDATQHRLQFTIRTRKDAIAPVLQLAGEMLAQPSFPAREFAVIKKQFEGALQTEAENTRTQAAVAYGRLLYEKNHPNRPDTTKEKQIALRALTRADIVAYHTKAHGRSSLVVTAAGDANISTLKKILEKQFALLPKNAASTAVIEGKTSLKTSGSEVIHIKGKASVDYMTGTRLYLSRTHKDYPALVLGSRILGNRGFTGRLMRIVREQEGLTYGIYAYMNGFEAGADGDLVVWGTFAPSLFAHGRSSVKRELSRLLADGFTEKEFAVHKELMLANWYVNLSNTGALAGAMHTAVLEGGGVEYLDTFPETIQRLTPTTVRDAVSTHVDLSQFAEAAAGTVDKDALSS